jgi:hypothetical protein
MDFSTAEIPSCEIKVDKEGTWYYKGCEIVQREIVRLFYQHLERDEDGRYVIHWRGERCYVEVEDTPFVVWETKLLGEKDGTREVYLFLSDGTEEALNPKSLFIGPQSVPYCRVQNGRFLARFSRKAYYQLASIVEEDHQVAGFFFEIGSQRFYIQVKQEHE